ncbi:protein involved in polysaccharide export with SLBB domain [Prosthecobacter fusiformis]|uniref:Protein involved in polysaccharide export with SLBB domain n=1 Tax=Prosthecobacter fusiformis TaxID=48464 RepID=A0A4R7S3E6_9BACT|nr:polysaccharide biosynthesis/export family protein [Prosthecobacter fusiformis]TDU72841.1 protein involved in polysaccharide export with SLBB domain [Prosthecobacter fusiformis]
MFVTRTCAFLLIASASVGLAQDPGFREIDDRRPAAPAPAPTGDVARSAAVLNSMDVLDDSQVIESGDLISMRVVEDRGAPQQMRVGATGEVNAPHIGLVKAAGRTCRQLAYEVKRRLEMNYYNSATVVVAIDLKRQDDPNARVRYGSSEIDFFTVYGQVLRQGKYELPADEDITISQAILRAGGFAQFANPQRVKLVRKTPQGNKTILVNLDSIMRQGNLDFDVYIRNNDVLIVDEKKINF